MPEWTPLERRPSRPLSRLTPPPRPALERHVIADVRYRDETITCTCGEVVNAQPDELFHDRHQPLAEAWAEHRRQAGVRVLSVAEAAMNHRGLG
jgi:hypothetical protein